MKYIMITHWDNHWDKLQGNRTYFTIGMLKPGMTKDKLADGTQTIFIKKNKESRKADRAWVGNVANFREEIKSGKEGISFDVKIERVIDCPSKYLNHVEGWYCEELQSYERQKPSEFEPPFFSKIVSTNDWSEFEEYTYYLLKLLGIHEVFRFPRKEQRGRADGLLLFENLTVLFDTTLETDFEKLKQYQIDNFCSQLKGGRIKFDKREFNIGGMTRQVWIITRISKSREIKIQDGISVKEVSIFQLIDLYNRRILEGWDTQTLENTLKNI